MELQAEEVGKLRGRAGRERRERRGLRPSLSINSLI